MERAHDTMMNPPIEELLDRVDSKFGLVTLAARRARRSTPTSTSSARASATWCPPQVPLGRPQAAQHRLRGDRRRQDRAGPTLPDEVDAADVDGEAADAADATADRAGRRPSPDRRRPMLRRQAHRPRRHRGHRRVQGRRGLPPARRRRRPRRAGDDEGRRALHRPHDASAPWPASRCRRACGTRPDPIPHTRLGQTRRPRPRRAGHRPAARRLRRRAVHRPADQHPARHAGAGLSARRCTPRCGSTRPSREPGHAAPPRRARRRARRRPPRRRRRRRRPPRRPDRHRRRRRARARRRATSPALHVVVTAGGTREPIDAVRVIANRSSRQAGLRHRRRGRRPRRRRHAHHHRRPARAARRARRAPSRRPPRCRPRCRAAAATPTSS